MKSKIILFTIASSIASFGMAAATATPPVEKVAPAPAATMTPPTSRELSDSDLDAMEAELDRHAAGGAAGAAAKPGDPKNPGAAEVVKPAPRPRFSNKGQYFRVEVGVGELDTVTFRPERFIDQTKTGTKTITDDNPNKDSQLEFEPGVRASFAAGFNFNEYVGVEFEIQAQFNRLKHVETSGGYKETTTQDVTNPDTGEVTTVTTVERFTYDDYDSGGSLWQVPVTGNLMLQYPTPWNITPFAGFGGGLMFVYTTIDRLSVAGFGLEDTERVSGTVLVPAWQAFGGLRWEISKDMGVMVTYKYLATGNFSFNGQLDGVEWDGLESTALNAGLNFRY